MELKQQSKISYEGFPVIFFLTITGGFLNAYTYVMHGEYLASMNTGNMIRMGISIANADLSRALLFLVPILSNCFGATMAYVVREKFYHSNTWEWQTCFIRLECVVLLGLLSLPHSLPSGLFHVIVSLLCGMQLASFPVWNGLPFATTLASGNIRFLGEYLGKLLLSPKLQNVKLFLQFFALVIAFPLGGIVGIFLCRWSGQLGLLLPILLSGSICGAHLHLERSQPLESKSLSQNNTQPLEIE